MSKIHRFVDKIDWSRSIGGIDRIIWRIHAGFLVSEKDQI